MPNNKTRPMIACDQCMNWFHKDFVGVKESKSYKNEEWICQECKDFLENLKK